LEYLTAEEHQRIKRVKGVSGGRLPTGRSVPSVNFTRYCACVPTIPGLAVFWIRTLSMMSIGNHTIGTCWWLGKCVVKNIDYR
jgi:hypothetical protein